MMKVLALAIGNKDHETARAIKLNGRWFPKSAIKRELTADDGSAVLIFKPWFVRENQWLIKDNLGIVVSRGVRVKGELVYQGNQGKLASSSPVTPRTPQGKLDAAFNNLVASGMSEREAAREIRRRFNV